MKVDIGDDLPPHMTPGQYKINMQGNAEENGETVPIFNEIFFMRVEP